MRRLILRSFQSPGDMVMISAAVRDLHRARPGEFLTDVRTSAPAIWENNPDITPLREGDAGVESIEMHYPLIHQSNERPYHFIHGYVQFLEQELGVRIPVTRFCGDIHLSDEERRGVAIGVWSEAASLPERYWIVVAGGKYDFTAKWWDDQRYQAVVDHFRGRINFVQVGEAGHWHPRLRGVVDLVGQTTLRELINLVYRADGVLCPVTLAMHLAAAVPVAQSRVECDEWNAYPRAHHSPVRIRPCVVIAGGREPAHWEAYPNHQFIHTNGALDCCRHGGCWKSRCQLVGDGDPKDSHDVCEMPVQVREGLRIPRCMEMISVEEVVRRIEIYLGRHVERPPHLALPAAEERAGRGYWRSLPVVEMQEVRDHKAEAGLSGRRVNEGSAPADGNVPNETVPHAPPPEHVLIKFRHGLGDAVQLTTVLAHMKALQPNWKVDVAALVGKHSAFHELCERTIVLDREPIEDWKYVRTFDLEWPECAHCYCDSPSTKAERCLREVFGIAPQFDLCRYQMKPRKEAFDKAHRYFRQVVGSAPPVNGRYRSVLIHYEGNTSADRKNLPTDIVSDLCERIIEAGYTPVILDWDRRSPLPDGQRIFNPHAELELWGGTGTGDAESLAALIELSSLMVGVDSGPLHVAGACSTPTIGVWTRHHPLHYFCPADHVTHLVPADHEGLLRGDRAAGKQFFREHYHYREYVALGEHLSVTVAEHLGDSTGTLVFTRNFWIRADNAQQDLVVVKDIAEDDSYRVGELPMPSPVVVDVGAHIGCFAQRMHQHNPLARIFAVECCPENLLALQRNVGGIATVIPAAMTYERDVALLNAVYPNCATTGGSVLTTRAAVERELAQNRVSDHPSGQQPGEYWADFRPIQTLTIEQFLAAHDLHQIDVLKLDCEGSEFSILRGTSSLDRIGIIVGEYHGREEFNRLIAERFGDWELRILKDGDLGTFWLINPRRSETPSLAITNGAHTVELPPSNSVELMIDGKDVPPNADYTFRFVENSNGPATPVLYYRGKRVISPWSLELKHTASADRHGVSG